MEDVLVDVLECSVCLNQLDSSARVLPCQHTFCLGCLTDITASHQELRCPECRVLVTVPIEELPCNILLMRILEGIKNRPLQTPLTTATPATTDFSYILNLYNTSSVNTSTSTVPSVRSNSQAAGTTESLLAIGSLSLATNNTGFSNQVLDTIASISNGSFSSHSPQRVSHVVSETTLVSSSAPLVNVSSSNTPSSVAEISLQSVGGSHSSSSLLAPTISSVFSPCSSNVNSTVPAILPNNPFLERSLDITGNTSCSLTSSPVPFLINQNQPLSLHGGSQFTSPSLVQQHVLGLPGTRGASLSAAASPTHFLQQNIQQLWQSQPIGREQLGSHHNRSMASKYVAPNSYLTPSSNDNGQSNLSFSTFLPPTQSSLSSASLIPRSLDPPSEMLFAILPSSGSQSSAVNTFSATSSTVNALTTTTTTFTHNSSSSLLSNSASAHLISDAFMSGITSSTDLGARGPVPNLPTHTPCTGTYSSGHTSSLPSSSVPASLFPSSSNCNIGIGENICADNSINAADDNPSASVGGNTTETLFENSMPGEPSSLYSSSLQSRSASKIQNKAPVHARALYNYKGDETRDLSFQKGAVITLIRTVDQHWHLGESGGRRGFVPASYVEALPREDLPQGIALYDFKMTPTMGGGQGPAAHCLNFNKGDVLSVLRHVDHNWVEGSVGDRLGIFPVAFVQLNRAAAALLQPSTATTTNNVAAATSAANCASASVPSPTPMLISASATMRELNARNVAPSLDRNASFTGSLNCSGSGSNSLIQTTTVRETIGNNTSSANLNNEPPPLTIPANTGLPTASKGTANNMAMLYVARFSYQPQKADEVALTKGGLYAVTQRCHDGWFKGRCLTTHQTGVFPGNYLHPARSQTIADYLTRRNSGGTSDGTCLQRNNSIAFTSSNSIGICPTSTSPARALGRRSTVSGSAASPPPLYSSSSCSSTTALDASSRLRLRARRGCHSPTTGTTPTLPSQKVLSSAAQLQQQQSSLGSPAVTGGGSVTSTQAAPLLRERYRCIEAYPASSPRELSLLVGDLVSVVQHPSEEEEGGGLAEGWLYGLLHTTGQQGIFPVTFVEPL